MHIMAAGVHDTRVLGSVGQARSFRYGQGIHIRPQGNHRAGLRPLQGGSHPVVALAPDRVKAQLRQYIKNLLGRLCFLGADFRVFMEPAAPGHTLGLQFFFSHFLYIHRFPLQP